MKKYPSSAYLNQSPTKFDLFAAAALAGVAANPGNDTLNINEIVMEAAKLGLETAGLLEKIQDPEAPKEEVKS